MSQNRFAILRLFLLDLRAYNHGLKGPQKPKTYYDNNSLRSYLSPLVFTVRSGPVWRQDLAILSPGVPRDNACQLWPKKAATFFKGACPISTQKIRQNWGKDKCHRVLQGAAEKGVQFYFNFCGSPGPFFRKRAEYGFGEYGFKHRTQ